MLSVLMTMHHCDEHQFVGVKHACHVEELIANPVWGADHVAREFRTVALVLVFARSPHATLAYSKGAGQEFGGSRLRRPLVQLAHCFLSCRYRTQFTSSDTAAERPGARD